MGVYRVRPVDRSVQAAREAMRWYGKGRIERAKDGVREGEYGGRYRERVGIAVWWQLLRRQVGRQVK